MLKAWSISTTVRNPERIRDFLIAAQPLVGEVWNDVAQEKYQKLLIKNRFYGFGNAQFYNGLPTEIVKIINDTSLSIADEVVDKIVELKNYTDFPIRGRQSLNPLTKFGFVTINNGILEISKLGMKLLSAEKDFGDVFLRSFLKWQIPNPTSNDYSYDDGYNVVPFVATLRLIEEVNSLEAARGGKPVGLQKREFSLFVPTLINHQNISMYAREIIRLRDLQKGKSEPERKEIRDGYRKLFVKSFLDTDDSDKVSKFLESIKDYGDNTIRYFRLTKFIRIRGGGFYIDLEPSRHIEIGSLFKSESYIAKSFADKKEYTKYMSDDLRPVLPWETKSSLINIANELHVEIIQLENNLNSVNSIIEDFDKMSVRQLTFYVDELRSERQRLQEEDNHVKSQPIESVDEYISQFENIYKLENRALMLEYFTTLGLHAFNDAVTIKPNYPVGDDNEPTSTAPGGMSDIECYYKTFNMICEVTMLKGRDQWFNEGQPVMRHLRDFESKNKNSFCLFIAPSIHTDTAETFWVANTVGYKGVKQYIAPITITQFTNLLRTLRTIRVGGGIFTHDKLKKLITDIALSANAYSDSDVWVDNVDGLVRTWSKELIKSLPA